MATGGLQNQWNRSIDSRSYAAGVGTGAQLPSEQILAAERRLGNDRELFSEDGFDFFCDNLVLHLRPMRLP